jgi:hypothetical protein
LWFAQLLLRSKLDRAYDDRLSGHVSEDLWKRKSVELEAELPRVRAEMEQHEHASHQYEATGLQILELAQNAYSLYLAESAHEQARLVKMLLSNCTFDRGSLSPTFIKPFDLFAKGAETGDWLPALDDFRNWLIREAANGLLSTGSPGFRGECRRERRRLCRLKQSAVADLT